MLLFALFASCVLSSSYAVSIVRQEVQDPISQPSSVLGPDSDLYIVNKVIAPDGYSRSTTLAGGTFPGPLIAANKGDTFNINVIDQLTDNSMLKSTSVHWHGIFQNGTNYADGPAFVTQCPIATGDSFLYRFTPPNQSGTYWYHSHLSTQYCDGLRGPLVIYDPQDPYLNSYDVDDESTVITLADWYHVVAPLLNIVSETGAVTANSTLINGLGRYAGGPQSSLAVVSVQRGTRYRFRLVAISCDPNFTFSIDNHTMTVIEADGSLTEPLEVDSITIYAAQRYSFILNANQPIGNYWIRALPNAGNQSFADGQNSAILRYNGAPNEDPTTPDITSTNPLLEYNLHALIDPGAPGIPEIGAADINLNLLVGNTDGAFTINGVSFVPPTVPVLLQILSGSYSASELLPNGSVYTLEPNKVVEISIPANAAAPGGPHPFHLHGHNFYVVRSAGNSTPNFANPVRRDTVSIGNPGDNVTFRFVTDNSGPWFLHCHIDWHLQNGFAVVMAENPAGTKAHIQPIPDSWDQLCPIYDSLPTNDL